MLHLLKRTEVKAASRLFLELLPIFYTFSLFLCEQFDAVVMLSYLQNHDNNDREEIRDWLKWFSKTPSHALCETKTSTCRLHSTMRILRQHHHRLQMYSNSSLKLHHKNPRYMNKERHLEQHPNSAWTPHLNIWHHYCHQAHFTWEISLLILSLKTIHSTPS